ncbi:DUF3592 domain-containing protein [Cellulomonas sp. McL0617]|uniref:DUF3592 domain-containing protein n=1 Tax=Cellulomonas sp. McL0617 TaxID=3415675 RepID=UPI003CF8D6D3
MSTSDGPRRESSGDATPLPIIWRVGRAGLIASRIGVALGTLALVAVATWVLIWPDADRFAAALVGVFSAFVVVALWRVGIHPRLTASDIGLSIQNPFEGVTVPWNDVVETTAGFDGITVTRLSAPPTTIWAVQKANFSSWRGARTRADEVAATLQNLAATHGATDAGARPIARRGIGPYDAVRAPLRFPWRMTRVEAAVIGFLRHSSSPLLGAATAALFGGIAVMLLGLTASGQWDAHVLRERGVVVEGRVLDVPGQVKVTWPGIAPEAKFLDGGKRAADVYPVGSVVDVLTDPQKPGRARLVAFTPGNRETAGQIALALGGLFLAVAYAKWSRWLAVARRSAPPDPSGRHARAD